MCPKGLIQRINRNLLADHNALYVGRNTCQCIGASQR